MNLALKNALIRAIRTFAQSFVGVILATWAGGSLTGLADITLLDKAAAAGVIAVLALIMNLLESATNNPLPKG